MTCPGGGQTRTSEARDIRHAGGASQRHLARAARAWRGRIATCDTRGSGGVPAGARGAGHDVHQARAAPFLTSRPASRRVHRGAREARRPGPARTVRGDPAGDPRGSSGGHVRADRPRARRHGVDRADPLGPAEDGTRGDRQGAQAWDRGAGRGRPRIAPLDGGDARAAFRARPAPPGSCARGRARGAPSRRARPDRGGEQHGARRGHARGVA